MARDAAFYEDRALERFEAGFASKAAQKEALADVNSAFDYQRGILMKAALDARVDLGDRYDMPAAVEALYWGLPHYPHQWKPKHHELVRAAFGEAHEAVIAKLDDLAALRDAIKAAEIAPPPVRAINPYEEKVRAKLSEIFAKRKADYLRAVELGEIFGGLPVSVNSHIVHGHKGAVFYRNFYYLAGRFVALNVILAAAEELERRKEG